MPFGVKKEGTGSKPWKVYRKDTGKVVGSSSSKRDAFISKSIREKAARDVKK